MSAATPAPDDRPTAAIPPVPVAPQPATPPVATQPVPRPPVASAPATSGPVPPSPVAPPPHRGPRRGTLVAALVVAVLLLVGSVGATFAWAHAARGPFASDRTGIERFEGPRSPNGSVRPGPGMPGRMFDRSPAGRRGLPQLPGKQLPGRPVPTPSPTASF